MPHAHILKRRGRDRLYIIAEILLIAKDGSVKTRIMYRANLSFSQLNEYLSLLLGMKFLKKLTRKGKEIYKTTSKGMKYLEAYKHLLALFPEIALESEEKVSLSEV